MYIKGSMRYKTGLSNLQPTPNEMLLLSVQLRQVLTVSSGEAILSPRKVLTLPWG